MSRRTQAGFSLVEVILALGLLAMVLISIAGLFLLGGSQVRSGRSSSEALSVARAIVEEMEGWGFRDAYGRWGFDGAATSYIVDTRVNAAATRWQAELDSMLRRAYGRIEIFSLGSGGMPPALNRTRAIRVVVTVHWDEGGRQRSVSLGTVRL